MSWKSFAGSLGGLLGAGVGATVGSPEAGYAIGSSIGNDISTNYANKQNVKNTWELLNYQNEYNSPKNQMARYVEANLNPNLIYGQQNYSASSSMPDIKPSQVDSLALYNMELQNLLTEAQIRNVEAKTKVEENKNIVQSDRIRMMKEWGVDPENFTGRIPSFFVRVGEKFGNWLNSVIPGESIDDRVSRIKSHGILRRDNEGKYYMEKVGSDGRFHRVYTNPLLFN